MAKKMNYTPWLIGLGAAGIIGYIYRKDIRNFFMPQTEQEEEQEEPKIPVIENKVTTGGYTPVPTNVTAGLNSLGTPKDKLNMDQYLNYGDRGQEIAKMQQILNRIAVITKKAKLTEDGIYGDGTRARLSAMFGNINEINLYKLYIALFAIWAASTSKNLKNWFNTYQAYLTSPELRGAGRTAYFQKNTII